MSICVHILGDHLRSFLPDTDPYAELPVDFVITNIRSWCSRVLGETPQPLQTLLGSAVELREHRRSSRPARPISRRESHCDSVGNDTLRESGTQPGSGWCDCTQEYSTQAGKVGLAGQGRDS